MMQKLKVLGLSIAIASVVFSSPAIASAPDSILDQHTDSYFWDVHPEMRNRQIQPSQTQYKEEWLAIREVLESRLTYQKVCYKEGYGYDVENYGETLQALADAVFYVRHPGLAGRKIRPNETGLIEEWNSIVKKFPLDNC
jgi:hypothetical protein